MRNRDVVAPDVYLLHAVLGRRFHLTLCSGDSVDDGLLGIPCPQQPQRRADPPFRGQRAGPARGPEPRRPSRTFFRSGVTHRWEGDGLLYPQADWESTLCGTPDETRRRKRGRPETKRPSVRP